MIHIVSQELIVCPGRARQQPGPPGKSREHGQQAFDRGWWCWMSLSFSSKNCTISKPSAIRYKMDDANEFAERGKLDIRPWWDWKKRIREYLKLWKLWFIYSVPCFFICLSRLFMLVFGLSHLWHLNVAVFSCLMCLILCAFADFLWSSKLSHRLNIRNLWLHCEHSCVYTSSKPFPSFFTLVFSFMYI